MKIYLLMDNSWIWDGCENRNRFIKNPEKPDALLKLYCEQFGYTYKYCYSRKVDWERIVDMFFYYNYEENEELEEATLRLHEMKWF